MKSLFLSLMSIMAASAFATPEPVNCREIISYKPIYSGPVQCDDTYTQETCKVINSRTIDLITQTHTKTLYSSAAPTTKSTMVLRELITFQESYGAGPGACTIPKTVTRELSCIADVRFSHNEEVKSTVCDYKPVAGFSAIERGNLLHDNCDNWKVLVCEATGKKWSDFTDTEVRMVERTCKQLHKFNSHGIGVQYF